MSRKSKQVRLYVRVGATMKEKLEVAARKKDLSLNKFIQKALAALL